VEVDVDTLWPLHESNVGTGLPLEGVRVLDLSRVLAGPLCAMIAGDLGADVIKVEAPSGDPVRELAPPRFGDDATYYLAVNRHRRNVVADLSDPDDYAHVGRLVACADAVVENFLPTQSRQLGVDTWREAHPNTVWITVTSAASGGPVADQPTFDLLAQARSGLMGVTGADGGEPTKVGAPIADVVAGLYAAIGLVTGLFARVRSMPGRRFESPLLEGAISALVNQAQGYLATGVNPRRLGNDHPSIAPYGPVRTADGEVLLAVATDSQYRRLVNALDDPRVSAASEFATNDERVRRRSELRDLLETVTRERPTDHWVTLLERHGVPVAPILDVAGALAQPQVAGGDFVGTTIAPAGEMSMLRSPLRIDGRRPPIRRGPRRLGEDDEELGF
jgi:crotonobetainyl-CoA:carnitine CoA-transferase CaiB-like acyl-CoA transferase